MPLPKQAYHCEGGCNCGAVRYAVEMPAVEERPKHPLASSAEPVPLPFTAIDHCNDCRRATASILPAWLCAPIEMVSVSLVEHSAATLSDKAAKRQGKPAELRGSWTPAKDVFVPDPPQANHFLKSFESSYQRWRWFCERCGTNVAYTAVMPEGFPDMLDITLGSVDREFLDAEELVPERHLWWDYGVDWIRGLATKGLGMLPIHHDYRLTDTVQL